MNQGAIISPMALAAIAGLAFALTPVEGRAIIAPIACQDNDGAAFYDYTRLSDDIIVTTMWDVPGLGDAAQVRMVSCSAKIDVRVTLPRGQIGDDYVSDNEIYREMIAMGQSEQTFTFAQVADVFATRGLQSDVVSYATVPCVCALQSASQ